jgi:hypothetical protein
VTIASYTLRPSLRSLLLTFLVHHNPFYLLSAVSMLIGCYALNAGLATRTGEIGKLLALIGVLNFYELILIALGLYLIRRRGLIRDGRTLLLLEIPFLVDLAFLNAEASSVSLGRGLLLNGVVLSLALLKVGIVMRVLFGRIPRHSLGLIAMQLTLLLTMPSAFKWFEHRGDITQAHFYLAWWAVGLLLVVFELQEHFQRSDDTGQAARAAHAMRQLYMVLPLASAVAHLSMLHWVYRVHFTAGDLSPVLIGVAFAVGRLPGVRRDQLLLVRLLAPVAAIIFALNDPPDVHGHLFGQLGVAPWVLTLAAAYVTWVYCFFRARAVRLVAVGAIAAVVAAYAPQLYALGAWWAQRTTDAVVRVIPRTAIAWGLLAIGGAFAFLTFGAALSLRKDADLPIEQAPPSQ